MSGFLLDTNIPSEMIQSRPDTRVSNWIYAQEVSSLFLSSITIGEIRRGIVLLQPGKKRTQLERWFHEDLLPRFDGRIYPVSTNVGDRWGILDAEAQLAGMPRSTADGLIAATALEHDLILVTRNVKDFAGLDVPILNPWAVPLEQPYRT